MLMRVLILRRAKAQADACVKGIIPLYYDIAKNDWLNASDKNKSYCLNLMGKNINSAGFYWGFETCLNERLREQANETPREFHY